MTNRLYLGVTEESSKGQTIASWSVLPQPWGRRLSLGSRRHGGFI